MYDLRWIRENPDAFDAGLAARGLAPLADDILSRDEKARANRTKLQELQNSSNTASKMIGQKKSKGEDADDLIAEVSQIKGELQDREEADKEMSQDLRDSLSGLPNRPEDDVPIGPDEDANIEVRRFGEPTSFDFAPREHFDIGEEALIAAYQLALFQRWFKLHINLLIESPDWVFHP